MCCLSFSKKEETTVGRRRMLQSARSRNVLSGLDRQGEITVSTNSNLYKLGTRPVSSAPTINYALDRLVNVRSLSGSSSKAARGNDRHGHVHLRIFNCGGPQGERGCVPGLWLCVSRWRKNIDNRRKTDSRYCASYFSAFFINIPGRLSRIPESGQIRVKRRLLVNLFLPTLLS